MQSTRTGRAGYVPIDYLEPAQKATSAPNKTKASPSNSVNSAQKSNERPPFNTPETNQGVRMSLSSLLDKAKSAETSPRVGGLNPAGTHDTFSQTPAGRPNPDMSFATNTPPSDRKIAADSLPFGLGESPAFGKQSLTSLSASVGRGATNDTLGKSSKLLKAAKTVQNMVRVTNIVAAPRVPSLSTAAEREDFDELIKRNDEYFARLVASQVSRDR